LGGKKEFGGLEEKFSKNKSNSNEPKVHRLGLQGSDDGSLITI
jgi:hypothetical protein